MAEPNVQSSNKNIRFCPALARAFVFTRVIPDYVPALNAGLGAHSLLLQKKRRPARGWGGDFEKEEAITQRFGLGKPEKNVTYSHKNAPFSKQPPPPPLLQ